MGQHRTQRAVRFGGISVRFKGLETRGRWLLEDEVSKECGGHSGGGVGPSSVNPLSCALVALWAERTVVSRPSRTHQKMALGINSPKCALSRPPESVEVGAHWPPS